jgi:hypothetical protein
MPCPPTPLTAMFKRLAGEQLIRFGIKNAPAERTDADLRKSLLVGFIIGLVFRFMRSKSRKYIQT